MSWFRPALPILLHVLAINLGLFISIMGVVLAFEENSATGAVFAALGFVFLLRFIDNAVAYYRTLDK